MCTAVSGWMDGWMDGWKTSIWQVQCHNHHQWPHPLRRSNSNAEPLQPQVTLRWRLPPPPVFTAATLPSPTPHLTSSRPPSLATSRSFCLSAFVSLWDCYKLVTHRSGGNNPETQSRTSDGDRGQAIRVLAELSRELISPVSKRQWRTTRSWRKLVKEPMARYLFFFPRVKLDCNVCVLQQFLLSESGWCFARRLLLRLQKVQTDGAEVVG